MRTSTDRIVTTHVGSLARPVPLLDLLREKEHDRPYDAAALDRAIRDAVVDRVQIQVDAGIDTVTDGEMSKVSFLTYVKDRLAGFDTEHGESLLPPSWQKEIDDFPEYYADYLGKYRSTVSPMKVMLCTGPVSYAGHDQVAADIATLRTAIDTADLGGRERPDAFLPSSSPAGFGRNEHYAHEEEYLVAVAAAMREEYLAITQAGLVLQVDDPWLIEILTDDGVGDADARRRRAEFHVELLNTALEGIPQEQIRLHTCYGLNHGPRLRDLPLADVLPYMLRIRAGGYSFEVANPRHQHEWRVWSDFQVPDGAVLMPGFLGHATNYVEHPELIAEGITQYAGLVGRERVVASSDCGFSSRATYAPEVHPTVAWAKLRALGQGAQLATQRLWSSGKD